MRQENTDPQNARELTAEEFPLADAAWIHYHDTSGNPKTDRIFAVFIGTTIVSLARCRRHPDGMEVDGVFTLEEFRRRHFSSKVISALTEACHNDDLFMYSLRSLADFYMRFGFKAIPENQLPGSVQERYRWAAGNLAGADVVPMRRDAGF